MTHQVVKSFISDSLYDSSDWAGQQWTADHLYCSHFPYLARTQPRRAQGGRGQLLLKIALMRVSYQPLHSTNGFHQT